MSFDLSIKPAGSGLEFLSLGALVRRLDPGIIPFRKATHGDIHVSGGEFSRRCGLAETTIPAETPFASEQRCTGPIYSLHQYEW